MHLCNFIFLNKKKFTKKSGFVLAFYRFQNISSSISENRANITQLAQRLVTALSQRRC